MIRFLKNMVTGGNRSKISRADVLASHPIRNPAITWAREAKDGAKPIALLQIPRRRDRWGNFVAKVMRLPDARKLELDEIGSDVWEMCDGATSVDATTKAIVTQYRLNRRQAETSVTAYLKQLAERRLIALRSGRLASSGAKATKAAKASKSKASRVPAQERNRKQAPPMNPNTTATVQVENP